MMAIPDEMLIAYADGELSPEDTKKVEAALADLAVAARLEAQMRLRDLIAAHYAPVADEPVPERLRALVEPRGEVIDFATARERRRFMPSWRGAGAIAALLVVGVIVGQAARPDGIVAERGGKIVAAGELDRALGTQLASLQPADADVRIGLTFRAASGEICRTFEADATAGIACRDSRGWVLRRIVSAGRQASEYRRAGSADIVRSAQAMMTGEALDAEAERAERDRGWK